MSTASSDRRARKLALFLFIAAFVIRLIGINWGLPNDLRNSSLHPDEPVIYWNYAYRPNVLFPGNYNYPTLYPLLLRGAGDLVAAAKGLPSPTASAPPRARTVRDFEAYLTKFAPHQAAVLQTGRILNAFAGAGSATAVYFLLLEAVEVTAGLLGGGLLAISPLFVVHSRFATVDVLATFFLWLALLCAVKIYFCGDEKKISGYAILAGIAAGLSAGTKYTGALALLSIAMALFIRRPRAWPKLAVYSILTCAAVFILTTPGALLDHQAFMSGIQAESQHMSQDQELTFVATPPGFAYQLGNLFTGIGPMAFLIGLAGLIYGAVKQVKWIWIILPFFLVYFYLIGTSQVKFARYALPLVPAIACGFGYAMAGALRRPRLRMTAAIFGLVAVLGLESLPFLSYQPTPFTACFDPRFAGLLGTIRFTGDMLKEDPRDQAARYLKEKPQASVGLFWEPWFWTVPVIKDEDFLYNFPDPYHLPLRADYFHNTKDPAVSMLIPSAKKPDYAVATSFELAPFDRIKSRDDVPGQLLPKFYQYAAELNEIQNDYVLDKSFGGDAPAVDDLMFVQPRVEVYRKK